MSLPDYFSDTIDLSRRFPQIPLLKLGGHFSVCEYDQLLNPAFGHVIESLMNSFADDKASFVQVEPPMSVYRNLFNREPFFEFDASNAARKYFAAIEFEPSSETGGAFSYTSDALAVSGSSGSWSVWGQRDWEIGLLRTDTADGPWLARGVYFQSAFEPFDGLRGPEGWVMPLSEGELAEFRAGLLGRP